MKNRNIIIFSASVVLVSILCSVQGEHKKRDVHRIIIQDRIPRSRHVHNHDVHQHGNRNGYRTGKKGSKPNMSREDMSKSFEDSGSYSMESREKVRNLQNFFLIFPVYFVNNFLYLEFLTYFLLLSKKIILFRTTSTQS